MPRAVGKAQRQRAKGRARRHGTRAKAYNRAGMVRRWLAHQLAGKNGYSGPLP